MTTDEEGCVLHIPPQTLRNGAGQIRSALLAMVQDLDIRNVILKDSKSSTYKLFFCSNCI